MTTDDLTVDLGDRILPIRIRRHARARRMTLRLDPTRDGLVVTLPPGVPAGEAARMARDKAGWIATRFALRPEIQAFADGATIPFLGVDHIIRHQDGRRGVIRRTDGEILIAGAPEHLARRLTDWLKQEARHEISPRVAAMTVTLNTRAGRITLRDTRSRWGSCSATGNLSFSWRLVLAPVDVLHYVVAHEVAHLVEHNHGPAFWRTVARLVPDYEPPRRWLKKKGTALHCFG